MNDSLHDVTVAAATTTRDEAVRVAEGFVAEADRRSQHLRRTGRESWDAAVDGPVLTLNIDEASEFLSYQPFVALIERVARMSRKTGIDLRIETDSALLADWGGSMVLRDWWARSGQTAGSAGI